MTERPWYHTLDFPDGTTTPGVFDTRGAPAHVNWPSQLVGGRCLDVGTYDGFWAFEMESRGAADVVAIDVDSPEAIDWSYDTQVTGPAEMHRWRVELGPGFVEAAKRMGSRAQRVTRSVYDLDPQVDGTFDVVLCGALLLHLRDPVRALEAMRRVCRGALVLVEALDPVLDLVARRVPAARFRPARDQWWRVNSAGLNQLTRAGGFSVDWVGRRFLIPFGAGAAPGQRPGRLPSLAARQPWRTDGMLYRALVATPRPPEG